MCALGSLLPTRRMKHEPSSCPVVFRSPCRYVEPLQQEPYVFFSVLGIAHVLVQVIAT